MSFARTMVSLSLAGSLALGTTGCIKRILLAGQMGSTKEASAAVNTISDFEVARGAAFAGLAQFEGMHYLGPDLEDGMFLLMRAWSGTGVAFLEDDLEQAEDLYGEDSELYEYHKARAVAAYTRSVYYGQKLLDVDHPGLEDAIKGGNDGMIAYLEEFEDPEDAGMLFWTGQAWLSKVNMLKDDAAVVGYAYVGQLMVKRSVELDETYNYASGHIVLGAYHSRSALAQDEFPESKKHFERAIQLTEGKALLAKFNFAAKYYCTTVDKANYEKLMNEILEAGDTMPEQRLQNTIAKRKAKRYLTPKRMEACGF